jgi:inner membrane protein
MMAGSHVALGAAAWFVVAPRLGMQATEPVSLGLALIGSLLPDIDHPKSWMGKRLRPLSTLIASALGHRGATHSALAVLVCGWLLLHGGYAHAAAPLLVGYLSHLAGDLLTPRGLRLAWPFKGTWALPICKSGSPLEPMVVVALLGWACYSMATLRTQRTIDAAAVVVFAELRDYACGQAGHLGLHCALPTRSADPLGRAERRDTVRYQHSEVRGNDRKLTASESNDGLLKQQKRTPAWQAGARLVRSDLNGGDSNRNQEGCSEGEGVRVVAYQAAPHRRDCN